MAIELATRFEKYVDEMFSQESKKSLLTNNDFDWTGARTVKIYKVSTATMNDYSRNPEGGGYGSTGSRYGEIQDLEASTEEMTLSKDRSFTFAIDKLDRDETGDALEAAGALARQQREVIIPEIDSYVYGVMCADAGTKADSAVLTADNIYDKIIAGNETLDDAMVPETGRCIVVTPSVYVLMKKSTDISKNSDIGTELRQKGVVGILDGCNVIKVPASRVPAGFGFMICHPMATVAPVKLEEYKAHQDPPGISGDLCEGRICYDAFVLENKADAIYYQPTTPANGA